MGEKANSDVTRDTMPGESAKSSKTRLQSEDTDRTKADSAENRAHPIMAKALSGLTGNVIVLGRYRGSVLRSAKPPHRQLWVPVKVGLNLRKVDLEVGLNPEDNERMEETIFASGGAVSYRTGRHLPKTASSSPKMSKRKIEAASCPRLRV